ncbi:MAG: hypothetical protein AAFR77_18360, partial [Cyanobacteria bacterium J06631_2]
MNKLGLLVEDKLSKIERRHKMDSAMEELLTLRKYIEAKNYLKALELVGELEEMSKEDKLNKIYSYAVI